MNLERIATQARQGTLHLTDHARAIYHCYLQGMDAQLRRLHESHSLHTIKYMALQHSPPATAAKKLREGISSILDHAVDTYGLDQLRTYYSDVTGLQLD